MIDSSLPAELAVFAQSVRMARQPGFDWRAGYARLAAKIPPEDAACARLFQAIVADIEKDAGWGARHAYHNPLHTLDAMHAVDLLCATAARIGLAVAAPHLLLIVMLGHDLRHPGGASTPAFDIERMSADTVATFARGCGVPGETIVMLTDLILATRPAYQMTLRAAGGADLREWLVGEADVLASLLPGVGLDLSADLTREMAAAGQPAAAPFESAPERLRFLGFYKAFSAPARALGLADVVASQIGALNAGSK